MIITKTEITHRDVIHNLFALFSGINIVIAIGTFQIAFLKEGIFIDKILNGFHSSTIAIMAATIFYGLYMITDKESYN